MCVINQKKKCNEIITNQPFWLVICLMFKNGHCFECPLFSKEKKKETNENEQYQRK